MITVPGPMVGVTVAVAAVTPVYVAPPVVETDVHAHQLVIKSVATAIPRQIILAGVTPVVVDVSKSNQAQRRAAVAQILEGVHVNAKSVRSARSAFLDGLGRVFGLFPQRTAIDPRSDLEIALAEISEAVRIAGPSRG